MNFGERNAQRKKMKDLRGELKQIRKQMLASGCDKGMTNRLLGEFEDALVLGDTLSSEYEISRMHLNAAREKTVKLLAYMADDATGSVSTTDSAYVIKGSLQQLISDLDLVYHDCSIRQDDMDFKSTVSCLKEMVAKFDSTTEPMQIIMLRSELENIKAVLDDTAAWNPPDFLALAYYFLHEDKNVLREMENEQRNVFVLRYLQEQLLKQFYQETDRANVTSEVKELSQSYIYE